MKIIIENHDNVGIVYKHIYNNVPTDITKAINYLLATYTDLDVCECTVKSEIIEIEKNMEVK